MQTETDSTKTVAIPPKTDSSHTVAVKLKTHSSNTRTLSIVALVTFAALSAVRDVEAKHLFRGAGKVDPVFLTWFGCLVTWIFFYVVACFRNRRLYIFEDIKTTSTKVRRQLMLINVGTIIAFVTTFLAIDKLTDPYINSIVDYGASPVVTAVLAVTIRREKITAYSIIGMLVSLLGIFILASELSRSEDHSLNASQMGGLLLASISCLALGFNQIWNKGLLEAGILRERVIVNRLMLAIVGLGIWCAFKSSLPAINLGYLVIWSLFGMSLPLFLIVLALEYLDVTYIAYALFLVPVFTLVAWLLRGETIEGSLAIYVLAGLLVIAGVLWAERATHSA